MTETFTITKDHLGLRIDKLLAHHFPHHSRNYFQYLIDKGCILLNGRCVKKQERPALGDEIAVCFVNTPELDVKPEEIPLDIIFEDEQILVVNKPASMVIHPAPGATSGTFANALMHHCQRLDPSQFDPLRPGIVHRLDKDTSGILIAAKTLSAHQNLSSQFSARQVEKHYLAICDKAPPNGIYSAPIKRHVQKRKEMRVDPEGKNAISHFQTLGKNRDFSLVEIQPVTGRTHQIRVHLKELGCVILGDKVYGILSLNRKYQVKRQLLHAQSLKITHPLSGKNLLFEAAIADDMKKFIDRIEITN